MLCDGDSQSFIAIDEAKGYGFIPVVKEACTSHIQKQMGTARRTLVQKHKSGDGQHISGKGRLTSDLINKISSY